MGQRSLLWQPHLSPLLWRQPRQGRGSARSEYTTMSTAVQHTPLQDRPREASLYDLDLGTRERDATGARTHQCQRHNLWIHGFDRSRGSGGVCCVDRHP